MERKIKSDGFTINKPFGFDSFSIEVKSSKIISLSILIKLIANAFNTFVNYFIYNFQKYYLFIFL